MESAPTRERCLNAWARLDKCLAESGKRAIRRQRHERAENRLYGTIRTWIAAPGPAARNENSVEKYSAFIMGIASSSDKCLACVPLTLPSWMRPAWSTP
ncbi:hypothetical protein VTN96DRAFT_8040 [Rasamsonia emersonii]